MAGRRRLRRPVQADLGADLSEARAELQLFEEARERSRSRLRGRDRWATLAVSGAFLVVAAPLPFLLPWRQPSWLGVVLLVAAYAVLSRIEFEIGTGSAIPTELVLVPTLVALPPGLVPLCVGAGFVLGGLVDHASGRIQLERSLVLLASSWHAVGPALVLGTLHGRRPEWSDWPLLLAALGAQFAFDLTATVIRQRLAFGIRPRQVVPFMLWVFVVDTLLAPVGLLAALATSRPELAFLLLLPLAGLLALLARERRQRIDQAVALDHAVRDANEQARRDALTGLRNRLAWDEMLALAERERAASGEPVSLVFVDVDELKEANDSRGHPFGDALLCALAGVVAGHVRERDVVARIGGDEFAVLLRETDEILCSEAAARLAEAIAAHPGVDGFPLSASVGSASCPPWPSLAEAQADADVSMYERKRRRLRFVDSEA